MRKNIMKKFTLFFSAVVTFLFFITSSAYSQKMVDYTWDDYHVKFKIPATFNVDKNNATEFGAGDDDAYLSIYPKSGESLSFSKMKKALEDWASDSYVTDYTKVNELEDLNGYWGVYLDGTKSSNNLPTTMLLLVHPSYATTRLYVWINYRSAAFDTALKMLKSFTPTY
jgi:hypothetical protein